MLNTRSFLSDIKAMSWASCAGKDPELEDSNRERDRTISKQLKQWHRAEEKQVKLLLLGTAESGKSTFTKQMKIIHINGYHDDERKEKVKDIRKNLKDAILTLLGAMKRLGLELDNGHLQCSADYLFEHEDSSGYTRDFYEHTAALWQDSGVRECFRRSYQYQLIDSAKYFLDQVDVIRDDRYIPSDQDILRCRVMTNSIQRIDFNVKDGRTDVPFSVFDVGGQQGDRRKWIQMFDSATAIMFVLDCNSFDQCLREDHTQNRLLEAAAIFEQVWNSRFLRYISMILFINKIDLLEQKINNGRSFDTLVNNVDQSDPYYDIFQQFHTFNRPHESERREFEEAFPRHGSTGDDASCSQSQGRKRKQSTLRTDINEEVIRTAVFIKRLFMSFVQQPIKYDRGKKWHSDHTCEYFYTCAVDTHTIKKVLEGCRSLIIKRHLGTWGM